MKAKAFLIAALCAMSFSLIACGGASDDAAEMDTTNTATAPVSEPVVDTAAPAVAPVDTAAPATAPTGDTTTVTDTVAK